MKKACSPAARTARDAGSAGARSRRALTLTTLARSARQVKTGFSARHPYSRWCRPPAAKLGEPTSVSRESDISCSVRGSSDDGEAGTRDGDTHLLRGGFIIEPQGASSCLGAAARLGSAPDAIPTQPASRISAQNLTFPKKRPADIGSENRFCALIAEGPSEKTSREEPPVRGAPRKRARTPSGIRARTVMVETRGFEPPASALRRQRSPS